MYPQTVTPHKRLSRPREGRVFFGVCAGLARRFDMKPRTMRLIFIVSCLLPGPQVVAYLILALLMPNDPA